MNWKFSAYVSTIFITILIVVVLGSCSYFGYTKSRPDNDPIRYGYKPDTFCDLSQTLFYDAADSDVTKRLIDRHNSLIYERCLGGNARALDRSDPRRVERY